MHFWFSISEKGKGKCAPLCAKKEFPQPLSGLSVLLLIPLSVHRGGRHADLFMCTSSNSDKKAAKKYSCVSNQPNSLDRRPQL